MYHIVYISTATAPVSETDLEAFLTRWRHNNEQNDVTGMLLYSESEGRFMQVIEGEEATILTLFNEIKQDCRHRSLLKLADGPIVERNFSTWLMGFKVVTTASFNQLAGYIEPDSLAFQHSVATAHDQLIQQLLMAFSSEQSQELKF